MKRADALTWEAEIFPGKQAFPNIFPPPMWRCLRHLFSQGQTRIFSSSLRMGISRSRLPASLLETSASPRLDGKGFFWSRLPASLPVILAAPRLEYFMDATGIIYWAPPNLYFLCGGRDRAEPYILLMPFRHHASFLSNVGSKSPIKREQWELAHIAEREVARAKLNPTLYYVAPSGQAVRGIIIFCLCQLIGFNGWGISVICA